MGLRKAQDGEFFANAGRVAGIDAGAAEQTLGKMGPAIAAQLRKRKSMPSLDQIFGEILGSVRALVESWRIKKAGGPG